MFKTRFLIFMVLIVGILFGCEAVEESEKTVDNSEKQIEQIELVEQEEVIDEESLKSEYLKFNIQGMEEYLNESLALTEHYKKLQESPSLMFNHDYLQILRNFESRFMLLHRDYKEMLEEGKVPQEYIEIHELNQGAFEMTMLSVGKNIEILENGDFGNSELQAESLFYQEVSNAKIEKATELMKELTNQNN